MRAPLRLAAALFLAGAATAAAAAAAGCAGDPGVRAHSIEPGRSPAGLVFIIHGVWPDGWWVEELARDLRARSVEPVPVAHTTFVWGALFGGDSDAVAERIEAFARAFEIRHRAAGCPARPRFSGIGYSGGTLVLLAAADRGVPLERAYFGGSPIFAWSGRLERALAEGRIGALVNYCSPLDGVGAILGCGALGFRGGAAGAGARGSAENRAHLRTHLQPVFGDREEARAIAAEIAQAAAAGAAAREPRHRCFDDPAFFRWYAAAKARLATEDAAPEPAPDFVVKQAPDQKGGERIQP